MSTYDMGGFSYRSQCQVTREATFDSTVMKAILCYMGLFLLFFVVGLEAQERSRVDVDLLRQYAQQGDPEAQFELGVRLIGGELVDANPEEAAKWLALAVSQGHSGAMNALGTLFEQGKGVKQNDLRAFQLYEASANAGFVLGQHNLAECYDAGRGVEINHEMANRWLLKAAAQDFGPSQALYAWKLAEGQRGLSKNLPESAKWYLRAAQNDHVPAITHMAYLYYTGRGVPQDYRRADAWYRRAIRSNDPWAQNDYGWFLSVCPEAKHRDGERAVNLVQEALEQFQEQPYQMVDTLAAAHARKGDFASAVQQQIRAIALYQKEQFGKEKSEKDNKLEDELNERLGLYKRNMAYEEHVEPEDAKAVPLAEDRILQEEPLPRHRRFPSPKPPPSAPRSSSDDGSVV